LAEYFQQEGNVMTHTIRFFTFAGLMVTAAIIGVGAQETEVKPVIVLTDAEKATVKDFEKRVHEYEALHKKLSATVPALPEKATPEQIDQHRKSMTALIKKERKSAKPGDFFTPGMVALAKRASRATVAGTEGQEVKESIMDENPVTAWNLTINDRYPEAAPVTSMPAELLQTLPKLPEGQEYRFVGKRLVLVDACCQLVLDTTPGVLP
jgi:hypothetical protein